MIAVVVVVLIAGLQICSARGQSIVLPEFTVDGFTAEYEGTTGNVFLGIPFAQPPVGDLRLEKPAPLAPSNKVIKATTFATACYMQEDFSAFVKSSEDCLYLNIITPSKPPPPEGFPVIFWIHGGGFNYGGTGGYGYNKYLRDFISRDVIYVNFQYRLAFWGFFTTNSTELPGNLGHWDQREALKFINRNIAAFGGNPNKITVGGHSAGSASANTLALSPQTRDLFQYSIQQSGGSRDPWALRPDLVDFAKKVASNIGCGQSDNLKLKACMKEKADPKTILSELKKHPFAIHDVTTCPWTPILDNDFFGGKTISQLIAEAPAKPVLYTITSGEGLVGTMSTDNPITSVFAYTFGVRPEVAHEYTRANLTSDLSQNLFKPSRVPITHLEQAKTYFLHNFVDVPFDESDDVYYWKRFTDFVSQLDFEYPMVLTIKERLAHGWNNQYVLLFDYLREADIPKIRQKATPHGYEYFWLSDMVPYFEIELPETPFEIKWRVSWAENFAHFAHHGKPQEATWSPVSSAEKIDYLKIGQTEIETGSTYFDAIKFWDGLFAKYDLLWSGANKGKLYAQDGNKAESSNGKTEL